MGLSKAEAARLLCKSVRAVRYYEMGCRGSLPFYPPEDTRLLMAYLAQGVRPDPWPLDADDATAASVAQKGNRVPHLAT